MSGIFRFADFELDGRSCELRKRGRRLRVQQQPLQILAMLVAAPGDIVTRDELRERIWGTSTHVDFDRAINKAITHLRQVLDDDASHPRFIETLPKRGYRFASKPRAFTIDSPAFRPTKRRSFRWPRRCRAIRQPLPTSR